MGTLAETKMNKICSLPKEMYNLVLFIRDVYRLMRLNFYSIYAITYIHLNCIYGSGGVIGENVFWNSTYNYCHAF